ncbi:MAG: carboxymuconolactone decarboxylase family protein [Acidobacteria bacterium]|nr:carboxymuconolactone decarboxylase family protein [Acidobacteriota bacterium]
MAWIWIVPEEEAEGRLARLYQQNRESWGGVDNILKIHSAAPETLPAHLALYQSTLRGRGELSRTQREMIAVAVSALNRCVY